METVWKFETERFTIKLNVTPDYGYVYDGEDEDGEVQRQLDDGEFVAFDSDVVVMLDGVEIGSSSLGGSVYAWNEQAEFWTAHRDPNPMNRNCTIMRGQHPAGPNVSIGHYFPSLVAEAIAAARAMLGNVPNLRAA